MVPVEQLAKVPFFKGVPAWAMRRLAADAREVRLERNESFIHQHDQSHTIWFLLSGSVQILLRVEGVDDLLVGRVSENGALLGWSAFRAPYRYSASVRCEEECRLLRVPHAGVIDVIEKDPRVGYELYRRVAAVLADRLEQTRDRMLHPNREPQPNID